MDRKFKNRPWNELLKARDAFVMLDDLKMVDLNDMKNFDISELVYEINEEIGWRYENNRIEGGDDGHK